jgi:hypothetical protein
MQYTLSIKDARLLATRDQLNGGVLELLGDRGVLARYTLDRPCGVVMGGLLVFAGFPKIAQAESDGVLLTARITRADGLLACHDMSVAKVPSPGAEDILADVMMESVDVTKGNLVRVISAEIRHA